MLDNLTSLLAVELLAARTRPAAARAADAVAGRPGRGRGGRAGTPASPGPDVFLAPVLEAARARWSPGRELRAAIEGRSARWR